MTRNRSGRVDTVNAAVFLTPSLILFILFIVVPTIAVLALSLYNWNFFSDPTFVGFSNFTRLVTDPQAGQAVMVTLVFLVLGVVPTVVIGFMLAVLVNTNIPGIGVLRVLYFIPVVVSVAVSAVLWTFLYNPRQGPLSGLLRVFGIHTPDILGSTTLALPAIVIMMIWGSLPIVIVLYMAGLQRIPDDIYSAASLDGAGPLRVLWSMTWPNVASTTVLVAVLQIINFTAGSLDFSLIMTKGGPLGSTTSLGLYAFQEAFLHQDVGYASVLSVAQMVLIIAFVLVGRLVVLKRNS
jgi:ABC-type sugar transport system permease subunit